MAHVIFFFTFVWPCWIVTNFFTIKPTRCTKFTNLFWRETVHVSDSSSDHHQELIHCTFSNGMSYRFVDGFQAGPGWNWSCSKAVYKPVWHILSLSVQWINSWWWTEELSETCRVLWQNKFVKLVHLVGFIVKPVVLFSCSDDEDLCLDTCDAMSGRGMLTLQGLATYVIRVGYGDTQLYWNVDTLLLHYVASLHRRQLTSVDSQDRCQNVLVTAYHPGWGNTTCVAVMHMYCTVLTCKCQNVVPICCDSLISRPDSLLVWYLACKLEDCSKWVWHLEVNVSIVYCVCMSLDTGIWTDLLMSVTLTTTVALEVIRYTARLIWSVRVKFPSFIVVHKQGSIHCMYTRILHFTVSPCISFH